MRLENRTKVLATVRAFVAVLLIGSIGIGCSDDASAPKTTPAEVRILRVDTLSTNGSTRATAYAMSNKIITKDGKIFVSWLDYPANIMMQVFDTSTNSWGEAVEVGQGVDNHSGPALTMDNEGYFHIAFGPHHDAFQYKRSLKPMDISAWTPVERFGTGGTYPSLISDADGTLYCTYRSSSTDPWRVLFQQRPARGAWSKPLALVDADTTGYAQFGNSLAVSADGELHMVFHIYDQKPAGGKYAGYMRSRDHGKTWESAEGRKLTLPVTPESPCIIDQGAEFDMRTGNIALDSNGNPWFGVIHLERSPRTVDLWHHNGQKWETRDLQKALVTALPKREVVGAVISFDNDGALHIASTVEDFIAPGQEYWGQPSQEIVLLTLDTQKDQFQILPISTPDAKQPNWIPSIERPYNHQQIGVPSLIFTHGGPGKGLIGEEGTEVIFVRVGKH